MNSVLQGLLPFLNSNKKRFIDEELVKKILAYLYKLVRFKPDTCVSEHEVLVDSLCDLAAELSDIESKNAPQDIVESCLSVEHAILQVLKDDTLCKHCNELQQQIQSLLDDLANHQATKTINVKTIAAILITLSPLIGYFIYQSFSEINNGAILEDVDYIYPQQHTMTKTDQVYRLSPHALDKHLSEFRRFYFAETLNEAGISNPLPNLFAADVPEQLNKRFTEGSELTSSMGRMQVYPDAKGYSLGPNNLNIFRVFIRNLEPDNLLKRIRVTAELIEADNFPWHKIDVSADVGVQLTILKNEIVRHIDGRSFLKFTYNSKHSPITDLNVSYQLKTAEPSFIGTSSGKLDYLTTSSVHYPVFDKSVLHLWTKKWLLMQLTDENARQLNQSQLIPATVEQLYERLVLTPDSDAFLQKYPIQIVNCNDGSKVLVGSLTTIKPVATVNIIENISTNLSFTQLDGKVVQKPYNFQKPNRLMLTNLKATNDYFELQQCVGADILRRLDHYEPEAISESIVKNTLVETFANFLMGEPLTLPAEIALEKTLLFDFFSDNTSLSASLDNVVTIDKGQYAQLNIVTTHFDGGLYRFRFYFNDIEIDSIDVNLLWPQSLKYQEGDEVYFRQQ